MPVLQEIVEWSRSRPLWQRDALRRLVTQTQLTDEDYNQLFIICLQQHGIPTPNITAITPRPISDSDLPQRGTSVNTLTLKEVRNLRGVNAITNDSQLRLSASGLTVIYGDNATGKSGYTRLLKQLCRARGSSDAILPNVFDTANQAIAEADIDYSLDNNDQTFHWLTGSTVPVQFREVSIFDELSAGVYVDENCEVAYLPFGLDVLPRLADVCNEVSRRIQSAITQLGPTQFLPVGIPPATVASSILERLDQRDIEQEIRQHATFDANDQQRLEEITRTLSRLSVESPQARAAELRARASRFQILRETFDHFLQILSYQHTEEFKAAIRASGAAETAATLAHTQAFSSEPLPGVGTDSWRTLWEAARQYSQLQARQGEGFPPNRAGELCVLCFQPLEQPAIDRFQRLDAFVRDTVQAEADRARRHVDQMRQHFQTLSSEAFLSSETFEELNAIDSLSAISLRTTHEALIARRTTVVSATDPESLDNLPPLPNPPLTWLASLETQLRAEAATLSSAGEPEERRRLSLEQNELIGRQILTQNREVILTEVQRRSQRTAYRVCLQDTDTTGITRRNTDLTDTALISVLAQKFAVHLQALRVQHTLASISRAPGEHGTAYHRVEIRSRRPVRASQILSRGEHRAIALAAFLSELETQQSSSTIVFDDPVSSLDQDRRRYVATSIASLALNRPVIVFTHDLFFLHLLRQQSEILNVNLTTQYLKREGTRVGVVYDGFPWSGQNVRERIGVLKQRAQQAAALARSGNTSEYEREAKEIYGLMREAWERAVEELLLNGSVTRFSPEVHTRPLRNLWGLEESILVRLENAMTKTSRWLTGHDTATTATDPVPDSSELEADIRELENWAQVVRQHHQRRNN